MTLAIFDLDNTLLNGDSDYAWGEFLVSKGIVSADTYKEANDHFYQQYQQGGLNILEYLDFALKPLTQHSNSQLTALHQEFMTTVIAAMRLPKADALIAHHRQQGHTLLIITATNLFITGPIAKSLGIEHILASEPEQINGIYTGKVAGTPCFQEGKVSRLNDWLEQTQHNLEGSYFYSDSHNDLPLLKRVSHPVAVDADPQLTAYAEQHQWPCISLRD